VHKGEWFFATLSDAPMMPEHAVDVTPLVVPIRRLNLIYAQQPSHFAIERRPEIDAYFERRRQDCPALWNGQVLLLHRHRIAGDLLEGAYLQTDFASYIAWRDWGFPDPTVASCFSMGALRSNDGAWLVGVMGSQTAAAGMIYFPAGTPDPEDVMDGLVDLAASVTREVAEETGLRPDDYTCDDSWLAVLSGPRMAIMKVLHLDAGADAIRRRILDHLAREPSPELSDIRIVRDRGDLEAMMPPYMISFFEHTWS